MGPPPFGHPDSVMSPNYQTMPTPGHTPHPLHPGPQMKRPRPHDLDLSVAGMSQLDHSDIERLQPTPLTASFTHSAAAAIGAGQPPAHHRHHLPDLGPPSKRLRHDEPGGGAPSVVGQAGMPSPAPRPRGPKLKFTPEDDQLLIELKEHKNLTWK
jgi:hypothetical protein